MQEPLPLDVERHIDQVCDRFEDAWRAGGRPRLEEFLSEFLRQVNDPEPARPSLLRQLLKVEMEYRKAEGPGAKEYLERLPDQATVLCDFFDSPLPRGTRLKHHVIEELLGEGGMGRVYRARDVKLNRLDAIKLLKPRYAQDAEWGPRFVREARLLASLKHEHVAILHNMDETDGVSYLVMELVEGPTLADRLEKGPLPLGEALTLCAQIAEAVEYAHSRGVVHRDLKPANVKIAAGGQVKVLDFGLAKKVGSVDDADRSAEQTTEYQPQTKQNGIGTLPYMCPEQISELRPDDPNDEARFYKLCDVWAFGCVLYESLTGRRPFSGGRVSDVAEAILNGCPNWQALSPEVPARIGALIRRCLQKDPKRRHHCLADARLEIDEALEELKNPPIEKPVAPPAPAPPRRLALRYAVAVATALALALVCFGVGWLGRPREKPGEWVAVELLDGSTSVFSPRVSPDGRWLAYAVLQDGQTQIGMMDVGLQPEGVAGRAMDNPTGDWFVQSGDRTRGMINCLSWYSRDKLFFDRFFDRPVGIYAAYPPGVRVPVGGREPLLLAGCECPQVTSRGAVFYCRPDGKGRAIFCTRRPGEDVDTQVFDHPVELTGGWPPPAVRALHNSEEVVFCGRVFDESDPKRFIYRLDLTSKRHTPVYREPLEASQPIALSRDDRHLYTVLPDQDQFRVVRLPLANADKAEPETIWTQTAPILSLEVDDKECIYVVPYRRTRELLRVNLQGGRPERLGNVMRDNDVQPVELPRGRFVRPRRILGRDRLSLAAPGGFPDPLLRDDPGETRPPVALVPGRAGGPDRLAFVYQGTDEKPRVRLATFDQDAPVDVPGVLVSGLTVLAASPDGEWLYFVRNRGLFRTRPDGGEAERLAPDGTVDSVAVPPDPKEKRLLAQRYGNQGVKLAWIPLDGGEPVEIEVEEDPKVRLAPSTLGCGAINKDGRILVAVARPDNWFWQVALLVLDAQKKRGKIEHVPFEFEGDFWLATWSKDEKHILAIGHPFRTELWRLERRK